MLALFLYRRPAAEGAFGIEQVRAFQRGAAGFAHIAVLVRSAAIRAGPADIPVGKRTLAVGAENSVDMLAVDKAFFLQLGEEEFCQLLIFRRMRLVIIVKLYQKGLKVLLMLFPELAGKLLRLFSRFSGVHLYGRAVHVGSADVQSIFFLQLQEARIDICLDVFQQVAYMDIAVGVGKGGGDKVPHTGKERGGL